MSSPEANGPTEVCSRHGRLVPQISVTEAVSDQRLEEWLQALRLDHQSIDKVPCLNRHQQIYKISVINLFVRNTVDKSNLYSYSQELNFMYDTENYKF